MPAPKVAWGYVTRDIGKGRELLVCYRNAVGDPNNIGTDFKEGRIAEDSEVKKFLEELHA